MGDAGNYWIFSFKNHQIPASPRKNLKSNGKYDYYSDKIILKNLKKLIIKF